MAAQFEALGDRVLVRDFYPDTASEKPTEAIVRALGTGKTNDEGKKVPFDGQVGDRVLTSKYGGAEVKLDKKEYRILGSEDILGVIQ